MDMEYNFTPLNIERLKPKPAIIKTSKRDSVWTVFLLLGVLTLLIVAVVLFVLIRKKLYG